MGHIRKLGATLLAFAGIGLIGSGPVAAFESRTPIEPAFGSFGNATGMAVDQSNGDTYVLDSSADEVFVFGPEGELPAGGGPSSFTGVGTPGDAFSFAGEPAGLAVAKGEVVIPDPRHNRALKLVLNASHEYEYVCEITAYGAGGVACTSSGTTGGTSLEEPLGAAIDSSGDFYVSDFGSETIYEFNPAGTQVRQFAGVALGRPQYIAVAANGTIYAQKYGGHELLEFKRSSPTGEVEGEPVQVATGVTGVAYDQATERVIVDLGSSVEELDADGSVVGKFGEGVIDNGGAVAVNEAANHVYVLESGEVMRFGTPAQTPLPTVNDTPPSAMSPTRSSILLRGTINPNRVDVTYYFEYGTAEEYTSRTSPLALDSAGTTDEATEEVAIRELLPGTTYHYALVAISSEGLTVVGPDYTFTTSAPTPPTVATGGASDIAQTVATIEGTVDTQNLQTTYGFQVAAVGEGYGPVMGLGGVGAGAVDAGVSISLVGLQAGTTYHYRIVAGNVDGTTYGEEQSFATIPFVNAFISPPAPLPLIASPQIAFPNELKASVAQGAVKAKSKKKQKKRAKGRKKKK